jgi:transcriptional regulator with XRE-family HTH domain
VHKPTAAVRDQPTLLRVLLAERHWQVAKAFRAQFLRATRELAEHESDPEFLQLDVSDRQFQRWLDGARPRPYSCRVLEYMFDHSIDELIHPAKSAEHPGRIQIVEPSSFGRLLKELREQRGLSFRRLGHQIHYSHGYLWDLETGSKRPTVEVASALDRALDANGRLVDFANVAPRVTKEGDSEDECDVGQPVKRRSLLSVGGVAAADAALSTPVRVLQALDIVASDDADTLGTATDCLNELISYYSERLSVSSPGAYVRRFA